MKKDEKEVVKDISISGMNDTHPDILRDLDKFSRAANIMPKFILNSMVPYIKKPEIDLYTDFKIVMKNNSGVLYSGEIGDVYTKFSAIAGFFVRNYVNARLVMSNQISMKGEDTRCLDCRIMLVPDFHISTNEVMPTWRSSDLLSVLYHRASHHRPTVVYVENINTFYSSYGKLFKELLSSFVQVGS
jgi:hypothetical protein